MIYFPHHRPKHLAFVCFLYLFNHGVRAGARVAGVSVAGGVAFVTVLVGVVAANSSFSGLSPMRGPSSRMALPANLPDPLIGWFGA